MTALIAGLSSLAAALVLAFGARRGWRTAVSEKRFRDFAGIAAEWCWETDAELRFTYFSTSAEGHVGTSPDSPLGRSAAELWQDPRTTSDTLLELLDSRRSLDGVEVVQRIDGAMRTLSISARARLDRRGRFLGYRGIGRDVTADYPALQAARASEDKLRVLVDALPVCIAYVDRDMRYRLNNETYRTWFGIAPESLQGRPLDAVLGESAFEESRPAVECALQGERVTLEESLLGSTGTRRDVLTTMVPHRHEGEVIGLFVLSQDVSNQKRRVDHLAQSRRYLAAVLDGLDAGIVVLDSRTSVMLVNEAWRTLCHELTGQSAIERQRYGELCARLMLDAPAATRRVIASVEAHARGEGPPVRADVRCPTPAAERWFAISTSEFFDAGERCVLVAHTDVSERTRLSRRVRAQDHALARTVRLNSLGELAATIAHELNQPLTSIGNYASIALDVARNGASPDETLQHALEKLLGETRRSGAIVHRVSNFVRQRPGERRSVRVDDVVRTVASWLQERMAEENIRFSVSADESLPSLLVDVTQLEQLLYNLLGNAVEAIADAGESGGGVHVKVTIADDGETVGFRVEDTGPGPPPEVRDTLFEPFVTSRASGLGLGLAICRSIVETHGGRLWHESPADGVNAFAFTLPVDPELAAERSP